MSTLQVLSWATDALSHLAIHEQWSSHLVSSGVVQVLGMLVQERKGGELVLANAQKVLDLCVPGA